MDQLTLYNRILELSPPWHATSVDLKDDESEVVVTVAFDQTQGVACPVCGNQCTLYDQRSRRWRHLDTCQYKTIVEASVPRVNCPEHGVLTVQVPWADGSSHHSIKFENEVLKWAQEVSILAITRRFKTSWSVVDRIIQKAIKRGLSRRWEVDCTHLSVDETCIGKGRDFITILSNRNGQVIAISDGRSGSSLLNCLSTIPIQCLQKTRTISMDMSSAHIEATKRFFGNKANKMISIDHFHVSKVLTTAVSSTRLSELKEQPSLDKLHSHKTRYLWLRNRHNLKVQQSNELNLQQTSMVKTAYVWMLKEKARDIWTGIEPANRRSWAQWLYLAQNSGIKALELAAETIRAHLKGILTAMKHQSSNARAEAVNKNVKNLARLAHGFRNRDRYKSLIMFRYGQLDMSMTH
ncbi:ISL3 family transposase [Bacterioplanes sanyensis]|uniref:ISL3 family transposase n=1 Tax=Bacterioplanes sanyensis TaxID=1249553 RepID=A0A222FJG5_9GAMM|nr:ISL3 family transposase [Bacterioplanes sanyensis]ASP39148.1 ISL3 family transposase [Bacterioplanes sanyensis]